MPQGDNNRKLSEAQIQEAIRLYTTPQADGTWMGTKTLQEIFNVTDTALLYHFQKRGVRIRTTKEAYSNGKRSKPINQPTTPAPACKCGCGQRTNWISKESAWQAYAPGHYRPANLYQNREWLSNAYLNEFRGVSDIAAECGVHPSSVIKAMRKFGIPTRPNGETLSKNGRTRGENNPAWKGGIAKWLYAFNWKRVAGQIRKRDNYTCQSCHETFPKSSKLLHVHHIDGNKFNNDFSNLVCVCATCHPKGKRKEKRFAETI